MESALPMLLFLGLLFFFTLAILVSGYASREQERAERGELTIAELFGATPLLAPLSASPLVSEKQVDPRLVTRIERHVRSEHAIASAFCCSPSPRILHERLSATPAPGDAWFEELRGFLARERAAVMRFLSSPSVSLLHPQPVPAPISA
jgi:hypothetical protein